MDNGKEKAIFAKKIFMNTGVSVFVCIALVAVFNSCSSIQQNGRTPSNEVVVAFYNVENLFDTLNDPLTLDEDFTPEGKLQWNSLRYAEKLSRISEVVDLLPGEMPAFIGLCEIENRAVLTDLVKQPNLRSNEYAIIHADSPDERGIDVAALYDPTRLTDVHFDYYTIALPDAKDFTRDVLHVKARLRNEWIHFFVNHWPSRSGGQAESEPNRIAVAQLVSEKVSTLLREDAGAKIVIMGDFNDHPVDKSMLDVLQAKNTKDASLYNQMYAIHAKGEGSYFYKGEWGALDQMITSKQMMESTGLHVTEQSAGVLRDEKLLFRDKEGVARPSRSYAGDAYKGGYSDHLPVYLILSK